MKAVLIKNDAIKGVLERVTSYDNVNIYAEAGNIEGINPDIEVILLNDDVAVDFDRLKHTSKTKPEAIRPHNIKHEEDYKKKLSTLREQRTQLLKDTDHLMMPDYPISEQEKENLKQYRQTLRDFPAQVTKENIDNIGYPEKP